MRPIGYVLGHHSSPFLQFRAINGVPNASREFSFDHSSQPLHQVTLWRSPVSSRDLAIIWLSLHADEGAAGRLNQHPRVRKLWGAVGRWCGAAGELHMRRIPSIRLSMGEVVLGIFVGQIESRSKTAQRGGPPGMDDPLNTRN